MAPGLKDIIESLIFVSLDPISLDKIKETLSDHPPAEVEQALQDLLQTTASAERGITIIQIGRASCRERV